MASMTADVAPLAAIAGAAAGASADLITVVAALSTEELRARMDKALRMKTAAEGEFTICLAESTKREMFRDDGATSVESWTASSFGVVGGDGAFVLATWPRRRPGCPT